MSVSGVIDRLDDWINPIVVKELRQAVKSRLVTSMLLLFLGVQLLIVSLFLAFREVNAGGDPLSGRVGTELFMVLQAILLCTCMVLIPTHASIRLSNERLDSNADLLYISTLRPASIIAGKFFSALVLAMLVLSCCAPFMTFTYLLRGIDIPSILWVLGIDLLAVLLSTQAGLFLAALPASRVMKVFLFFFAFLGICGVYISLVGGTSEMIHFGVFQESSSEFWLATGVTTLTVLFCTGLLFCWSVALISPPSANRALLGRLFLVGMWLVLGALLLGLDAYHLATRALHGPSMVIWIGCSVSLFCLQLLISINERDDWGVRVTRTIPRWGALRASGFLFYSGSAGGVLLSVICVTLTLLAGSCWIMAFPVSSFSDDSGVVRWSFAAVALYTFCYGMSAVLLRAYLLRDRIRSVFNWVLALLLLGLGSSLPWIVAFIIHANDTGRHQEVPWWLLTNPFGAIYEMAERGRSLDTAFTMVCFLFLFFWAGTLFVLAIPWWFQQLERFHAPAPRVSGAASPATAEPVEQPVLPAPVEAR